MRNSTYNIIEKIEITAECTQPLHVGSADGNKESVLIHPVNDVPFIQATSIAGVFRNYCLKKNGKELTEELFGCTGTETEKNGELQQVGCDSRIKFTDACFIGSKEGVIIENRPRLAINRESGTCNSSKVKGSNINSGHKYNMHYIGAGAKIKFTIYIYGQEKKYKDTILSVLAAFESEDIQLGGQKSYGCGLLKIEEVKYRAYDMKNESERTAWINNEGFTEDSIIELPKQESDAAYVLTMHACTEGELQVKGITVMEYGDDAPDSENIRNARKQYIIPASSIKGVFRSQVEKIAQFKNMDPECVLSAFGESATKERKGCLGNIHFYDTVIGEIEENDEAPVRYRNKIDKFTGGVMHQKLFSEKNAHGKIEMKIKVINEFQPEQTVGLLILVMRDIAAKIVSFGSGKNIGKGYLDVKKIVIMPKDGKNATIDYEGQSPCINDADGIITKCLASLRKEVK